MSVKEEESRIKEILDSLQLLASEGDIPVHAFSMLMKNSNSYIICEQLHHKWLSDALFAEIAAKIIKHLHNMDKRDVALSSGCLALVINDYKNWGNMRKKSRFMFRNSVRALIELYPVYVKIDNCISQSMILPMFHSLHLLIDLDPSEDDIMCLTELMIKFGDLFSELNSVECDKLVIKLRKILCRDDLSFTRKCKYMILQVMDFWTYSWDKTVIPDCLLEFYNENENNNSNNNNNNNNEIKKEEKKNGEVKINICQDKEDILENEIIALLLNNDNQETEL
ncbi:MIF4-like, type 1/2/3 domain and Armadillo-type fold domain-containing protein [Strongyloides ratti]|uniref:MIF4-like, type 1/2/3 domain and Armadillo-type fold domain-containing protein n=1 Tax=Strongyloides ratti TaxID=34506 RepID=A0A090LE48_STRRB|nr:MIF4-like, type 1/2/3 domain and Armadillo-type fold domain-containing protein [Strongyloides ratti]CEF68032.1 MIF4-like, type 1/2/3 domain and Armadillo-type fold domain-containing protein [Strongyloides ratti]